MTISSTTFGELELARDFLDNYLPPAVRQELDLSTLTSDKETLVDSELQPYYSDMLYHVQCSVMETLTEKWTRQGWEKGKEEGREEGYVQGLRKTINQILNVRFPEIPEQTRLLLEAVTMPKLEQLVDLALDTPDINTFRARLEREYLPQKDES